MRINRFFLLPALLFLFTVCQNASSEPLKQYPAAVHMHTKWSYYPIEPEKLILLARQTGIPILMITDSTLRKWELNLMPWLGKILSKTVEQPSILKMGSSNYLNKIEKLNREFPDLLILPGTEAASNYYWQADFQKKKFLLKNWKKHILVFGIEDSKVLDRLPVTSNPNRLKWSLRSLLWLWPLLPFFLGIRLINRKRVLSILLTGISAVLLLLNFPFLDSELSPGTQDPGAAPYQNLIDYVNQHNGLTFWAHPEAFVLENSGKWVEFEAKPYGDLLLQTKNYTGFAIFFEGYREVGGLGGIWDQVLMQYLKKKREKPVWAIGELDFRGETKPYVKKFDEVQTVFWLEQFNSKSVLEAMRTGRMYARRASPEAELVLDEFEMESSNKRKARSGESLEVDSDETVKISLNLTCSRGGPQKVKLTLIKNGKILSEQEQTTPIKLEIEDQPTEASYYRLFIEGKYPLMLASNPIFVKIE